MQGSCFITLVPQGLGDTKTAYQMSEYKSCDIGAAQRVPGKDSGNG